MDKKKSPADTGRGKGNGTKFSNGNYSIIDSSPFCNPSQADLLKAMDQEPILTDFGLGIFPGRQVFEEERTRLAGQLRMFQLCCQWLSLCTIQRSINRRHTSYGLKHCVERYFGTYITNGAFIAAVIYLGIPYKPSYLGSPNISLGISSKLPELPKGADHGC